jgi:hypothetical protein
MRLATPIALEARQVVNERLILTPVAVQLARRLVLTYADGGSCFDHNRIAFALRKRAKVEVMAKP